MSDEFVKLLRNPAFGADATDQKVMNEAAERIEGLKAKLAKAVDALETIRFFSGVNVAESDLKHVKEIVNDVASKGLAELKGQIAHDPARAPRCRHQPDLPIRLGNPLARKP